MLFIELWYKMCKNAANTQHFFACVILLKNDKNENL